MDSAQFMKMNGKNFFYGRQNTGEENDFPRYIRRPGGLAINSYGEQLLPSKEGNGKEWSKARKKKWEQWKRERGHK